MIARRILIILLILPFLPFPQGVDRSFLTHISTWFELLSAREEIEKSTHQECYKTAYDHLKLADLDSSDLPIDLIEDSLSKEKEAEEEEEKEKENECRENKHSESEFLAVWWSFNKSDSKTDIWHEQEIHFHINYSISGHLILRC